MSALEQKVSGAVSPMPLLQLRLQLQPHHSRALQPHVQRAELAEVFAFATREMVFQAVETPCWQTARAIAV